MNAMNNGSSDYSDRGLQGVHDESLSALDCELAELAAADRASARIGMEARITAATAGSLASRPAGLRLVGDGPVRRSVWLTPLRLAAGLGLAATIGVSFLAQHRTGSGNSVARNEVASVEQDVTEWLAISGGVTSDIASQLSRLDVDTSSLADDFSGVSTSTDLSAEEGAL